jgi:hypothetical protein
MNLNPLKDLHWILTIVGRPQFGAQRGYHVRLGSSLVRSNTEQYWSHQEDARC